MCYPFTGEFHEKLHGDPRSPVRKIARKTMHSRQLIGIRKKSLKVFLLHLLASLLMKVCLLTLATGLSVAHSLCVSGAQRQWLLEEGSPLPGMKKRPF